MQHRPVRVGRRRGGDDYFTLIRQPLHILTLLLPLIVVYEVGSRIYLSGVEASAVQSIRAHSLLLGFFQDLGIAGRTLPSIAIVLVLLFWHALSHNPWRVRPLVVLGMAGESLGLTMPLVVFLALIQLAFGAAPQPAVQADVVDSLTKLPWKAAAVVAIGAGLYEEFLFRLLGISALRLILIDLGRMTQRMGTAIAVVLVAAAFAAYHDVSGQNGQMDVMKAASLFAAGLYFGAVFALRGFGVAVGVHVVYDVCALILAGRTHP